MTPQQFIDYISDEYWKHKLVFKSRRKRHVR